MYDITNIKNYILFLKNQCGLSVTLHPIGEESLIFSGELITFNIHDNPYCVYVKSFPAAQQHCISRQHKILEKCKDGSFCGCCFAGCYEFVYPIFDGHKTVGFISVSGYRCNNADSYISSTAEKYCIPLAPLKEAYKALKTPPPSKADIDTLLMPLCDMLTLAYIRSDDDGKCEESLLDRILRYVKRYHTCNITLEDICTQFSCSRFHVSHLFKRNIGCGFREYLTQVRLEDAKSLLKYSKLSVTEISLSVGFGDSNYFSSVFKKHTGVSPLAYRRAAQ